MHQNTLLNTLFFDVSCSGASSSSLSDLGSDCRIPKLTRIEVYRDLPAALGELFWIDDLNGDVIAWVELAGGQEIDLRWIFDPSGCAEMLVLTAKKSVGNEAWQASLLSTVLDALPGAELSIYFRDEHAEKAPISVLYDPLQEGAGWLDIRFRS